MTDHLRIVRGSPTEEDARAITAAFEKLRRAADAKTSRANPWVLAARAEGTNSARLPRDTDAWKRSGRLGWVPVTDNNTGRGDAR